MDYRIEYRTIEGINYIRIVGHTLIAPIWRERSS